MGSVIVGISGHERDGRLLAVGARYAKALGLALELLHVNDPQAGSLSLGFVDHGVALDQHTLLRWAKSNLPALPDTTRARVCSGDWLRELVNASEGAELLVLGHRHLGWVEETFSDSADELVINRSHCPVLVVPDTLTHKTRPSG